MAHANELDNLLSKIGLVGASATEKHAFCGMFNYVLDPPVPLSPPKRSLRRAQLGAQEMASNSPALEAFRTVFKSHFRLTHFIDFESARVEAEADFSESLTKQSTGLCVPLFGWTQLEDILCNQMRVECGWLEKVNDWRRSNFFKSGKDNGMTKFRRQLDIRYPFEHGMHQFYEEAALRSFLAELKTKVVDKFAEEIPAFERNRLLQWRLELGQEIDQVGAESLETNRRNKEWQWEQKAQLALIHYKKEMESLLGKRPFANEKALDGFHMQAKAKCEGKHGLAEFLGNDPVFKTQWDSKISEKFRVIKGQKKAMADGRIRKFIRATLKAKTRKMIRKEFGCELEGDDEWNSLFSPNVAAVLRRKLERADETKFAGEERESDSESENDEDPGGNSDSDSTSGSDEDSRSEESSGRGKSSESESDHDSDGGGGGTGDAADLGNEHERGGHVANCGGGIKATLAPIGVQYDTRKAPSRYKIIIPKNTKLPTETFLARGKTKLNNQTVAEVCLWEGDRPAAASESSSKRLGKVYLTDLRPAKRGFEKLDLELKVDAAGMLHAKYEAKRSKINEYFKFKTSAWEEPADDL